MNTKLSAVHAALTQISYGLDLSDKKDFKSDFDFDSQDLWFGIDFDFLIDNWMETILDEIASDISSVDSTNLSEAHSEQISA